jgi:hypothetical protein
MKKHALILYREWMRPLRLPSFFAVMGLGLLWAGFGFGFLAQVALPGGMRDLLLPIAFFTALAMWILVLWMPRRVFVQCLEDRMLIQLGVLRMHISYMRIRTSRAVQHGQIHSPSAQPFSRQALAVRMALRQCILVELVSYPLAFSLLRAFAHPFLFIGKEPGFLFAVEDWMGLGRDVEQAHSAWLERKKEASRPRRRLEGIL